MQFRDALCASGEINCVCVFLPHFLVISLYSINLPIPYNHSNVSIIRTHLIQKPRYPYEKDRKTEFHIATVFLGILYNPETLLFQEYYRKRKCLH